MDDLTAIKVWDAHKLIVVATDGELVTVNIDQDNIGQIIKYFNDIEEAMNG